MRPTVWLAAVLAVLISSLATAGPVGAEPAMTVTPDTGVIDGQVVVVRGTGYTPGYDSAATLCSSVVVATADPLDCDLRFTSGDIAPDGTTRIDLVASRLILVRSETIDCADADACVVVLVSGTSIDNLIDTASAPIDFDDTPIPDPQVTSATVRDNGRVAEVTVRCDRPPVVAVPITVDVELTQAVPGVRRDSWPRVAGTIVAECAREVDVDVPLLPSQGTRKGKLTYPYRRLRPGPATLTVAITDRDFSAATEYPVDLDATGLVNPISSDDSGASVRVTDLVVKPGGRARATLRITCGDSRELDVELQALVPAAPGSYRAAFARRDNISCNEGARNFALELNDTIHPQRDDIVPAGAVELYAVATGWRIGAGPDEVRAVDMRPVSTDRRMRPRSIRIRHHRQSRLTIEDVTTDEVTATFRCKRDAVFTVFTTLGQPVNGVVFNDRGRATMQCRAGQDVTFSVPWSGTEIRPGTRSAVTVRAIDGVRPPDWTRKFQQNQAAWRTIP